MNYCLYVLYWNVRQWNVHILALETHLRLRAGRLTFELLFICIVLECSSMECRHTCIRDTFKVSYRSLNIWITVYMYCTGWNGRQWNVDILALETHLMLRTGRLTFEFQFICIVLERSSMECRHTCIRDTFKASYRSLNIWIPVYMYCTGMFVNAM